MMAPGTFEGVHRLETILHTPSYKVCSATYTILIWPIFFFHVLFMAIAKKSLRMAGVEHIWFTDPIYSYSFYFQVLVENRPVNGSLLFAVPHAICLWTAE